MLGHLADVQQPVGAGNDLHKGAEFRQPNDLAQIGFPHFGLGRKVLDDLDSLLGGVFVAGGDVDAAIVLDINLDAGSLDDGTDGFPARSDDIPNLVGADLYGKDSRRIGRDILPGLGKSLEHLAENKQPRLARLLQSLGHDRRSDPLHLDVHLQGGNPAAGSGHLEIHVAEMILRPGNVSEDGILVAFHHQTHGDSGHRSLEGNSGIHQRQRRPADGGHGTRPIRLQDVGDHAERVRKGFLVRDHIH